MKYPRITLTLLGSDEKINILLENLNTYGKTNGKTLVISGCNKIWISESEKEIEKLIAEAERDGEREQDVCQGCGNRWNSESMRKQPADLMIGDYYTIYNLDGDIEATQAEYQGEIRYSPQDKEDIRHRFVATDGKVIHLPKGFNKTYVRPCENQRSIKSEVKKEKEQFPFKLGEYVYNNLPFATNQGRVGRIQIIDRAQTKPTFTVQYPHDSVDYTLDAHQYFKKVTIEGLS